MTWSIQIDGHDDLAAEAKEAFESGLVSKAAQLVADLRSGAGVQITRANATTNTTGQVDLIGATGGDEPANDDAPAVPPDEAEAEEADASDTEDVEDAPAPDE